MFTRTTDPAGSREFVRPSYKHNVGTMSQIGGSISQGASGTLTATGLQLMAETAARTRAWMRGEEPMTEEEFNAEGHAPYMDFEEGLYPEIVKIRRNYKVGQMVNQTLTEDMSWYGNLGGNLLGGFAGELPFSVLPVGVLASRASATSKAMRLGNTLNVATSAEKLLSQGVVKGIRRATAADLFTVSAASQFAENSLIYYGSQKTDRDSNFSDIFFDTALGAFLGTGLFGVPLMVRNARIAKTNAALLGDIAAMKSAVDQGDTMGIVNVLTRNSPAFRPAIESDPELKSILQMGTGEIMEPENLGKRQKLVDFLEQNEDAIWYQHVRGLIPRDPELPVQQAIIKQEVDKAAIVEATATGNYENLTGEQLEFIIKADEATAETLQLIGEPAPKPTTEQRYAKEIEESSKTRLKTEARKARAELKRLSTKLSEGHIDIDPIATQKKINELQERSDRLDHAAKTKEAQKTNLSTLAHKNPEGEEDAITWAINDTEKRRWKVGEDDWGEIDHLPPQLLRFFAKVPNKKVTDPKTGESKVVKGKTDDRFYEDKSDVVTGAQMEAETGNQANQVRTLAESLESAWNARKAMIAREADAERVIRSDQAFFDNLGRSGSQKANEPTPLAKLSVGDTFKIKGEEFHVRDIDPESWELTVQDGRTMVLHMDDIVYTDNSRVMSAPYEAGQNIVEYIANAVHEGKTFPAKLLEEHDLDIPAGYRKLGENITPKLTKKQASKIRSKIETQKAKLLQNEAEVGKTAPEMRLPLSDKPLGPAHPREDRVLAPFAEKYQKQAKRRKLPTPKVEDAPKLDLHQHSAKVASELEANKVDRAKAAAERRAEKRREVEKRQKVYAKSSKEQGSRNTENISKHLEQSAGWATTSFPNIGKSIDGFRQYLASLIDAEGGEISLDVAVDDLIKLVDADKLEYAPEVMLDIHGIKVTHAKARGVASKYFKDPQKNEQYIGPDNIDEGLSRRLSQLDLDVAEGRMDSADAARTFKEYAIEMETAAIVRRLHSESIFKKKRAELEGFSPKQIIKYLKSSIDGLSRMGVNLKSPAIQNAINAEITISQAPMHEILTKHKLYDAFIDADNELMTDIMQSNRTGEIPERWKGENAAMFKEILEAYKQTTEALNGELNQYGANIRFLEGHSGVSQRWDSQTLLAAGYDKWSAHMMDAMDWEATRRNLGGVMAKERNEFGFAQDWVPADQEKYLQSMYDELTAPRTDEDHPSMDIAKSFGRHRNIALKPEAEVETLSLYSGHDSMGQLWLDQVRYKAEMTAITRELGNNPIPTFRRLVEDAGLREGKNTSRKKGAVGNKLHELDMKTMDWSLQYLTGKLDNPADLDVAQFGKTTRQISHILFLWQSTISAITDMPMAIHTVSQLGGTAPTATMVSAFGRALRRRFHGDEPNMRSYLTQHGANFDAMMSAGARHMGLPDSKTAGSVISRMSEATFALNGLNAWTGIMQEAFIDVMTRDMAFYIKSGKIDPSLRLSLEAAGVTESEFLALGDFVENVAGVDRLNINNEKVSVETKRKLMAFLAKYRDEAIMMPDASTAGMIRAGTQAGTIKGEVMRTMFQYQSFPLAMNRIAARKFLVNPEGGRPWTTDQVTFSNTIGFIGGMLAMSYVATVLKDLANGREPMHMGNMTGESWVRLVNQSGMGGMLQSLMEIGSGNPKAVIAPIPSTALKVAASDSIGEAIYQSRNVWSVGSMPVVAPVIQKSVAAVFDEAVGLHFDQLNAFYKMNTDQDPLFYAPR